MISRRLMARLTPFAFLAPAAAVLGVFFLGAVGQVVFYSFTRYTAFSGPDFVGLENYRRLLASERFWACLANSAIYLLVTPAIIALSLAAALVVESLGSRGRWLRLALFLPVITPTIVAGVAWRLILNEDSGLLNAGLTRLGLDPVPWLSRHPWTLVSAMFVTLWKGFGFYMMVFLAGLLAVPRELREAAALDGASRLGVFRAVTLPALVPSIVLVFIVSSISALKVFDELFVLAKGSPIAQQTAVPLLYRIAFEEGDYGLASALGLSIFLFILSFSLVNLRLTARSEEAAS
ncbi:MAG: carbohydrate ABC transporter permease [Phycisphaerales bacterium]|jgi:putative chitobiose transport system permease protein